ncbi:MAG: hypothetical protein HY700_05765 [Gemmatimonadetes bacterium]|nr:hypothetical protein [Gemmatimonadota bacterium]
MKLRPVICWSILSLTAVRAISGQQLSKARIRDSIAAGIQRSGFVKEIAVRHGRTEYVVAPFLAVDGDTLRVKRYGRAGRIALSEIDSVWAWSVATRIQQGGAERGAWAGAALGVLMFTPKMRELAGFACETGCNELLVDVEAFQMAAALGGAIGAALGGITAAATRRWVLIYGVSRVK